MVHLIMTDVLVPQVVEETLEVIPQERVSERIVEQIVDVSVPRVMPLLLRCSTTHCGFPPNADDLLSVRSCCLANVLLAPRFPSSRPSAPVCCCHQGFLGTREAGTCAGSRACSPFSFFSIFLFFLIFARSFRQPREMSSCVVEM